MLMCIISFYIIGCVLVFIIYDIIIYEKYNNKLFKGFDKKDIISYSFIVFSWFYLISLILRLKDIRINIMEKIKKFGIKFWEAYKESIEMQYGYIIHRQY